MVLIRLISLLILLQTPFCLIAQTSCGWFGGTPSSHSQVEGMSVVVGNKMYVFYGFVNGTFITNTVEVFDPFSGAGGSWSTLDTMPLGVTHTDVVVIDNEIWLIGGFIGNHGGPPTDTIQIYTPATNNWRSGPTLPEPHASGVAVLLGRKIHVIGGLEPTRSTMDDHHMVYDLNNPTAGWDTISAARPPEPRDHAGYGSMRGKIYIVGGQTGHDGPIPTYDKNELYVYDPIENSWTLEDTLPQARSHIETGTFTTDGLLIITGGNTSPCCPALFKSILTYNPEIQVWDTLCDMPTWLSNPAAKIIGNKFILAHGGEYGYTNPQSATYMFDVVRNVQLKLGFNPSQLTLSVPAGSQVNKKVMIYTISGSTPFDLNLSNAPSWLVGTQTSSATASPSAQEVILTIDAGTLSAGTTYNYNLMASESPSGAPQGFLPATLAITLHVTSALAVTLKSFEAQIISPQKVRLNWETVEEINHDFFVLERRQEKETGFYEIGRLKGTDINGANYSFIDELSNLSDGQIYYRLRIVDQDGVVTFSEIKSIFLNEDFSEIFMYPNPVKKVLNVEIQTEEAGSCTLGMYNLKGEIVFLVQEDWYEGAYRFQLDVRQFSAGCYFIKANSGRGQFTSKVVIR